MPITYPEVGDSCLVFAGNCAPEEAEPLLEWLRRTPNPSADLSACDELHTALAQLLLAGRVRVTAKPSDRLLAACLGGAETAPPKATNDAPCIAVMSPGDA